MSERIRITGDCPPGEVCDLEDVLIEEIAVVDEGAVGKANAVITKRRDNMEEQLEQIIAKQDEIVREIETLKETVYDNKSVDKKDDEQDNESIDKLLEKAIDTISRALDVSADKVREALDVLKKPKEYKEPEDYYDEEDEKKSSTAKSTKYREALEDLKELAKEGFIKPEELAEALGGVE